jgi:spore coat polysaccharide biosynthesis protein SpsF (cytidylyltransferase family)/sialic acid synthase SpsE
MKTYNILEVANSHGGDFNYLKSLIEQFAEIKNVGIKFQAFKFDKVATEKFPYYDVYKNLFFNEQQWKELIDLSIATDKEVWLDLFDTYGAKILQQNLKKIAGLKLQASVLYNQGLLDALSLLDLKNIRLILNVSGYEVIEIEKQVAFIRQKLSPKEIIIQTGIQSYPTLISDSGLGKISTLKKSFPYSKFSIADHADGQTDQSLILPTIATILGFEYIEKHIMLTGVETKYDFQSSLTLERYKQYLELSSDYLTAMASEYITAKEKIYLKTTIQIPILNKSKNKGDLIDITGDFEFKRTNEKGLNYLEVKKLIEQCYLLRNDMKEHDVIRQESMRKARIGSIIACRMKSSRLPKKALSPVFGNLSSIEICLLNTMRLKYIDSVTLATSTIDEDAVLADYTYHPDIHFFRGDPDDVIKRFIDVADAQQLDVIVRQTGDNMFMSNEIAEILLKSHFEIGADYTTARQTAIGANFEIMNVSALKKIKSYFKSANYSEYMTWYFQNNPEHFKLNVVDLPSELVRDYRLTLDYPEDLEMYTTLIEKMNLGLDFTIMDVFSFLDKNPEIANINANCVVKYHTDPNLIATLNEQTKMK